MALPIKTQRTAKWLLSLTDDDLKGFSKAEKTTLLKDCQTKIEIWGNILSNAVHEGAVLLALRRERNQLIDLTTKLR